MDTLLYAAAILAFVPTLLLMYGVLKKYTYPAVEQPFFSDPSFFTLFAVGLVIGTLMFAFYTYLFMHMLYAIMFAALMVLVAMAVLNLKRYHGKSDTVFYGYGLGLGIGCTFAFGLVYYLSKAAEISSVGILDYVQLFVLGLSFLLTISSVGTTIGEGVARLRITEFVLKALLINVSFGVVMSATLLSSGSWMYYAGMAASLLLSAGYFYKTMVVNLSSVVRDVLKMEGKKRSDIPK